MEFRGVFIANPARLSLKREQLVIAQDREVTIPMEDISSLLLESHSITITTAALEALSSHGVTVYICDDHHMPSTIVLPTNRHSRQRKLLGCQIALSKPIQKRLWQQIVVAKIQNQSRCLTLSGGEGGEELWHMAGLVNSGDTENVEGTAAAYYFPQLFGEGFTRGEDCLINSALNYGYAILRGAVARNLVMYGLEPCLGIHHHSQLNQFNLADDVMEAYRPLVDLFVATQIPDVEDSALTPSLKQQLFNLTNYLVVQHDEKHRCISAIGRCASSLSRVFQGDGSRLELPALMSLTPHRYE